MAGSTLNFDPTKVSLGNFGWFWWDVAIPSAGARITLHTDLTPESVANPNAKHLGHTEEGWTFEAKTERENAFVDEAVPPIDSVVTQLSAMLSAALAQTQDISGVLRYLTQGFGSYSTAAGYEQITGGTIALAYGAVALIAPQKADPTKAIVYNLYKALNNTGLANQIRRRPKGTNPVAFEGFAITSRAAADTTFNVWKQIA